MAERRGMGRGLAAILTATTDADDAGELRSLPVELIGPNPQQPRRSFDEASLESLAESVRARGIIQPVLVRPLAGGRYELIAGERRWRAAQLAELDEIPAVVRAGQDAATLELALIENMAREDLNPIDEARACAALVEELGLTREEVGRRIGRSRAAVSNLIRLLDLPDEVLDLLEAGVLTEGHGRALLLAPDHADRRRLARSAIERDWSVRELEVHARAAAPSASGDVARGPRSARPDAPSADAVAAAAELEESLERALGAAVKVRVRASGVRVELGFDDAAALAERLLEPRAVQRPVSKR